MAAVGMISVVVVVVVCMLAGRVERSEGGRGRCGSLGLERGWV